jgi:hypothetical protein
MLAKQHSKYVLLYSSVKRFTTIKHLQGKIKHVFVIVLVVSIDSLHYAQITITGRAWSKDKNDY